VPLDEVGSVRRNRRHAGRVRSGVARKMTAAEATTATGETSATSGEPPRQV
jgi:hypothetical protein